jgi:hypothetical protein
VSKSLYESYDTTLEFDVAWSARAWQSNYNMAASQWHMG